MNLVHLACALALASPLSTFAQERAVPIADVLDLEATVTSDVAPDLAVFTLAVVREGPDVPVLTKEVNEALAKAFADAKAVPGVVAANGGYSTSPRFDTRGTTTTRTGWQVRGAIVLKSKDFDALGNLVGRLSQSLQIASSGFEISPDLRNRESASLIERGARAFQDKAAAASRAFGYTGYSIRQVNVGTAGQSGAGRVMSMMSFDAAAAKSPAPMPVEAGQVTLSLSVHGSVQMSR
jgi:predicted secreted protein